MKCNCDRCSGNGEITCPDCNGQGTLEITIETIVLKSSMAHVEELTALKADAARIRRQAAELKALNPHRKGSYADQEIACLNEINRQADKIQNQK